MFLDDELNLIYERDGFCKETSTKLLKAALNRLPNPSTCSVESYLNTMRQIDGSGDSFARNTRNTTQTASRTFSFITQK